MDTASLPALAAKIMEDKVLAEHWVQPRSRTFAVVLTCTDGEIERRLTVVCECIEEPLEC